MFSALTAIFLCFNLLLLQSSCGNDDIPIPPTQPANPMDSTATEGKVAVWRSNKDGLIRLAKEPENLEYETITDFDVNIEIDESVEYQSMEGFGAALTGSSAYVIQNHLEAAERNQLLEDLFNPETGIGISFIRLTIGASDFSLSDYTYNDLPIGQLDNNQNGFDLSAEDQDLIPLLQKILTINPDIKIMATPWSPPAWMKDNNSVQNGGHLRANLQDSYATYFVKYIQEMAARNIPIHVITVQNEPLYAATYMSMEMTAEEQKVFIRDHLGPKLTANNLTTKIVLYDHNWDEPTYPLDILNDATAKSYVEGTAFHCYAGDVSAMSQVHNAHPDAGIYFTECSGGDFSPNYSTNLSWNTENLLVGASRNWSKTVLFWNLALDQNHGPRNGGCQDCRGVVTINSISKAITKNEEYVLLGHIAKFVKQGAKRIKTPSTRSQDISQVAFKNPDGTIAIVAFNHSSQVRKVQIKNGENAFNYEMEGGMLVTFLIEN